MSQGKRTEKYARVCYRLQDSGLVIGLRFSSFSPAQKITTYHQWLKLACQILSTAFSKRACLQSSKVGIFTDNC